MIAHIMLGVSAVIFILIGSSTAFVGGAAFRSEKIVNECNEKGKFLYMEDVYLCKKEMK